MSANGCGDIILISTALKESLRPHGAALLAGFLPACRRIILSAQNKKGRQKTGGILAAFLGV
ncbi:MAG: hypothetical protein WBX25_02080 [Rhodomicrobium sp.]